MDPYDYVKGISYSLIQNDRLLTLDTPQGDNVLVPLRAKGHSRLGRDYGFVVDTVHLSTQTIELKQLIAQPVTLWLRQTDHSYLPRHGYVHTARRLGSDGSLGYAQLEFSSWLHFLKFRKDARIWQDKTAIEILADVFNAHPQARGKFNFIVYNKPPSRSFCVQYEDDWTFAHRLMESEGLYGYFEQAKDGKSHTLVITDFNTYCDALDPKRIPFSRSEVNAEVDAFSQWSGERTLQSVAYLSVTGDYKNPTANKMLRTPTMPNQGNLPEQAEVYEYTGQYSYFDNARGDRLNKLKLEEWESRAKRFFGVGNIPRIDTGRYFELYDHPDHQQDEPQDKDFLVIDTRWYIENNLPIGNTREFPGSLEGELEQVRSVHQTGTSATSTNASSNGTAGFLLTEIEAQRMSVPYRSPFEHKKPHMRLQTAVVVGPQGEEVYTDNLNRVKLKFPWDRLNPGNEQASCWVRVMQSDTGGSYGGVHVPRVGEEVYVDWVDGDCDRPLVIGRAYNADVQPEWHSNGILSGFKSKEYGGNGYNQLVMDDATGQNRVQLYTTSAQTQLHMGYLVQHTGNTRGSYLGQGFDLKSGAYGAVRAEQGLYVSTQPASAQPLNVTAATAQLTGAEVLLDTVSKASENSQAASLQGGHDALKAFTDATQQSVASVTANGGRTAGGGTGNANGFAKPVMLLSSPEGIAVSTQQSVHVAANQHVNAVAGTNVNIGAGKSLLASVMDSISLFAQNLGIRIFAAKGPVNIQAQGGPVTMAGLEDVTVESSNGRVVITAAKEIWIGAGGSYISIKSGVIENVTTGQILEKCADWDKQGGGSGTVLNPLKSSPVSMDGGRGSLFSG